MYTIKERQYVEAIEKAYRFASITLLELLMQENDLMGRLRYVMQYMAQYVENIMRIILKYFMQICLVFWAMTPCCNNLQDTQGHNPEDH